MPGTVPQPTWIFHLTDITNLSRIIQAQRISCRRAAPNDVTNIAYQHLVDRADRTPIRCGPGGVLTDYARFFFAPRPPMLLPISSGRVAGRTQENVVHLVTEVQTVGADRPIVFTDGHAIKAPLTEFFTDLIDLDKVDWRQMWIQQPAVLDWTKVPVTYWNSIPSDPDRPRRRQAEFLVHGLAPWSRVIGIAVIDEKMATQVKAILPATPSGATSLPVVACPHWYY